MAAAPPVAATTPLDQTGTRRAVRFRIRSRVNVLVDGNNASLVNLSTVGAQVVSPTVLKPNVTLVPSAISVSMFAEPCFNRRHAPA